MKHWYWNKKLLHSVLLEIEYDEQGSYISFLAQFIIKSSKGGAVATHLRLNTEIRLIHYRIRLMVAVPRKQRK